MNVSDFTGISDEALLAAQRICDEKLSATDAKGLRACVLWLRTTNTVAQLIAIADIPGWRDSGDWARKLATVLPKIADVLYEAAVEPVKHHPDEEGEAFLREVFGDRTVKGSVDSFPIPASGPGSARNGHYGYRMYKGLAVINHRGFIRFAQGGFSGTRFDSHLLDFSRFRPNDDTEFFLGDGHFRTPYCHRRSQEAGTKRR